MSLQPKIYVFNHLAPRHLEAIATAAPGSHVVTGESNDMEKAAEQIGDRDILVAWAFNRMDLLFPKAPHVKWIHALTAGVDNLLVPAVQNSSVILTNSKGIHGIPMSEHVMAMALTFTRGLHILLRQQQQKIWKRNAPEEINGKTMAIVGLGSIGREIAKKAKALDLRVVAAKREMTVEPFVDQLYPATQMKEMLSQADFVVVTLPFTDSTAGLIKAEHFQAMKKSAYFINVSRGSVVNEADLITALTEKWIAGAGLDVVAEEPLPASSPLWEMPNVIITPHLSAISPLYLDRAIQLFADNLARYVKGEKLFNVIDKDKGY